MLKMRDVLKTKISKRGGFTLAELLVVVAIIAILVAVSIPIFSGKLNEARENTDAANLRAAKAAGVTYYLTDKENLTSPTYYDIDEGTLVETAPTSGCNKAKQAGASAGNARIKVTFTKGTPAAGSTPATKDKIEAVWEKIK